MRDFHVSVQVYHNIVFADKDWSGMYTKASENCVHRLHSIVKQYRLIFKGVQSVLERFSQHTQNGTGVKWCQTILNERMSL